MAISTLTHMWNGKLQSGTKSNIERIDPSNGELLTLVPDGTTDDAEKAIDSARRAFDDGPWRHLSGIERAKYINLLADLLIKTLISLRRLKQKRLERPCLLLVTM